MLNVRVFVKSISAENFLDIDKPVSSVQIATNLNAVGVKKMNEDSLEVPFVFTINYTPGMAQISMKGNAQVKGSEDELEQILKDHKEKKPPPPIIIQAISNQAFLDAVMVCRILNIPPPIPLPKIGAPPKKRQSEPTYRA